MLSVQARAGQLPLDQYQRRAVVSGPGGATPIFFTMKQLIVYDFKRMSEGKQAALTRDVIESMENDSRFQPLAGEVEALKTAYDNWQKAAADAQSRDRLKVMVKNLKREVAINLLFRIAMQVNLLANGNVELALASGLPMRAPSQKVTQIPPPRILDIKRLANSGSVEVPWTKERGVITYAVEYSTDHHQTWHNGAYTKARKKRIDGLTPGIVAAFRVKAIGSDVQSDWSAPVSVLVV